MTHPTTEDAIRASRVLTKIVGRELAGELVYTFSAPRFNGGEGYGRWLRRIEEFKHGSEAPGRLMDRTISVQSSSILLRAKARLGLVAPLLLVGAAAPAGVR